METSSQSPNLSSYAVTLPHNDFLPKGVPQEQLALILHHVQLEVEDEVYRKIELETGIPREHIEHCWTLRDGVSFCTFTLRAVSEHCPPKPGISVLLG